MSPRPLCRTCGKPIAKRVTFVYFGAKENADGGKALSGVCGSLARKGLVGSDGECIWLTAEGFEATC